MSAMPSYATLRFIHKGFLHKMADLRIASLSYAVRLRVVAKWFGQICIPLAAHISVVLAASIILGEFSYAGRYAVVTAVVLATGIPLSKLKTPHAVQPNEGLVITALIFLFTSLVMSYPMMAFGMAFEDALFEAVSAVTTTGLSTLSMVEDKPQTFLFARAWLQWLGGLGVVALSVALLARPGMAARRLIDVEKAEDFIGGTRQYALRVLIVYSLLTCLGIIVLRLLGSGWFHAVVHTLAGVSTGGFSSFDRSLSGMGDWGARAGVTALSFLGAVTLILYFRAFRLGWRKFTGDIEFRLFVVLSCAVTVILIVFMRFLNGVPLMDVLRTAPLLALSAQTTSGFSTTELAWLHPASKLLLIVSMTIGGTIGSTAGGIKVLRLVIMLKMLHLTLARTGMAEHAVVEPRLSGDRLENEEIMQSLLIIMLFVLTILISWIPFVVLGYDSLDALFEVVSATCTVGLSSGITRHDLPLFLKGVLSADMMLGRLEMVAILIVLYPNTWIGRRTDSL